MDTMISTNRKKKQQIVEELQAKIAKSKSMVFTNYQGLTHKQLEGLKKAAKVIEAEYVAAKNTLLLRALEDAKKKLEDKKTLDGPTAVLFIYTDIVEPLKLLTKTIKELKLPIIKFALLEGKFISDADVTKIASLPPLPVLQAQLLGQMKAPISGLHRALNWNLQNLVMTLHAIKEKKA